MPNAFAVRPRALAASLLLALPLPCAAQSAMDSVQIRTERVSGHVYVLFGSGGNIGLSVGQDGAFIVDDQFAPLSAKITAAIASLTDKPVRFVVNTHFHGDHSGGNENFGRTGAVIIAQDNVRDRLASEQVNARTNARTPAAPHDALPVITFAQSLSLHLNGDSVRVVHVANAHTDGDALIHYVGANVLHMGDTFFAGRYPYIDTSSGGTLDGIIAAADAGLAMARNDTRIIPGHGAVSTRADLLEYRRVLVIIRDRVQKLVAEGKSLAQVAAARPTVEFDDPWGKGFMNPEVFLDIIYNDLKARPSRR
ncbi:MAG: MBL fold metallo-hydrolase [Gemmatimonadaceae bacterium]